MGVIDLQGDLNERFFLSADYFAEAVQITPAGEAPVTLNADVGEAKVELRVDGRGIQTKVTRRTFRFSIDADAACGGFAEVDKLPGAAITYPAAGGDAYAVAEVGYVSEALKIAEVTAARSERTGGERPGLRKEGTW